MDIRQVSFCEYADDAAQLAIAHWQETEADVSDTPPRLNIDAYRALEDAGQLITVCAFIAGTDEIVGYGVAAICTHPHYGHLTAHHDLLFITPKHRKGPLGIHIMRAVEHIARDRGAKSISWHAKKGSRFEELLPRLGARSIETVFIKEI